MHLLSQYAKEYLLKSVEIWDFLVSPMGMGPSRAGSVGSVPARGARIPQLKYKKSKPI